MGDIVKRTAFYVTRKRAGKEVTEYMPFYLVEVSGATHSRLFQPVNFDSRRIGSMGTGPKIQVDEYLPLVGGMKMLMDGERQLMKFQSCEYPIA